MRSLLRLHRNFASNLKEISPKSYFSTLTNAYQKNMDFKNINNEVRRFIDVVF